MIFDHIVLNISNLEKSEYFYTCALKPLGIELVKEEDGGVGFGTNGKPSLWICDDGELQKPMHIAFVALDRKAVDEFYQEALKAGGKDNGAPGLRPQYHANYYGAFIIDPDGHNIEAVFRGSV